MKDEFTTREAELLEFGLHMRQAYIETGNPVYRVRDVSGISEEGLKQMGIEIKALVEDQMELILEMEELKEKLWRMVYAQ